MVPVQCRYSAGTVRFQCRYDTGAVLLRYCYGAATVPVWCCNAVLVQCRYDFLYVASTAPVRCQYDAGMVLVRCWYGTGTVQARCRYSTSTVLVWYRYSTKTSEESTIYMVNFRIWKWNVSKATPSLKVYVAIINLRKRENSEKYIILEVLVGVIHCICWKKVLSDK
jgi:hypothetical protein